MAIIKTSKIREMTDAEMAAKLFEFQKELNSERGKLASGGRTSNPGKIRELRRTLARTLTIIHERKLGIRTTNAAKTPKEGKAAKEEKKK